MKYFPLIITMVVALSSGCGTPPRTVLDDQPPRLVSAFFGLDNALPDNAVGICLDAPGADGMPVIFSRRVLGTGLEDANVNPEAFRVITSSGATKTPACATLRPASESSEGHTVLLVGDLGDGVNDPPVRVEITGSLPLAGNADGKGLAVDVTALEEGPTISLALGFAADGIDSDCPDFTKQIVMVVWAGGVTPGPGKTDENHRGMYTVTTNEGSITPFALGDLGDGDNYVHLCLDTASVATQVSAAAGVLVDPRGDLNPETSLDVVR